MSGKEVEIQTFSLGNNKVLWFPGFNKYIIAQPDTDEIIKLIWENPEDNSIIDVCRKTWDIEEDQANRIKNDFIEYIEQNIKINHLTQAEEEIEEQAFFSEINTI